MGFAITTDFDAFWATGGTLMFVSQSNSLGEDDAGRFFDKQQAWYFDKVGGGTGNLHLKVEFTGTADAHFSTPDNSFPAPFSPSIVTLTYNASSAANVPAIYINGVAQVITVDTFPSGTYSPTVVPDILRIGGRHNTDRSVDADYGEIVLYDHILTDIERNKLQTSFSNKFNITLS